MSLSRVLRGCCAIATSGALVLSTFPAMAQNGPPPGLPPADAPPPQAGQPPQPPQPPAQRLGRAELEKLLAPIALYPDDVVAQVLTASTYPIEVVEAERWASAHPNVHGEALQDAMAQQPWDPSVKGLAAVPQVLAMMSDKLEWTQQLGEAFLAQGDDVSNAIQELRFKAQANGNLKSSEHIRVRTVAATAPPPLPPPPPDIDPALLPPPPPPEYIAIEPVDAGIYYLPIYDPVVVYGPWPWPSYAPFYWYPPGYVVGAAVIGFSVGFFVGSALWCHYNWGWGHGYGGPVTINVFHYNQFNRTHLVAGANGMANWRFDAAHRGSVGFQNATLRQQFGSGQLHGNAPLNANFNPSLNRNLNVNGNNNRTGTINQNANIKNLNGTGNGNGKRNGNPTINQNANIKNLNVTGTGNGNGSQNANRNISRNANLNVGGKFNAGNAGKFNAAGGNGGRNNGRGNGKGHH